MSIQLTTFNVITFFVLGCTAWVMWARLSKSTESTWPLIYYLGVVIYSKFFEGAIPDLWLLIGVCVALLLRFEFMGGWILKAVRAVDLVVLGFIAYRSACLILMW